MPLAAQLQSHTSQWAMKQRLSLDQEESVLREIMSWGSNDRGGVKCNKHGSNDQGESWLERLIGFQSYDRNTWAPLWTHRGRLAQWPHWKSFFLMWPHQANYQEAYSIKMRWRNWQTKRHEMRWTWIEVWNGVDTKCPAVKQINDDFLLSYTTNLHVFFREHH